MTDSGDEGLAGVVDQLQRLRRIQRDVGRSPYDPPDLQDGRLYFWHRYLEGIAHHHDWKTRGDWLAYIIDPAEGYFDVYVTRLPERSGRRVTRHIATFSRVDDAGKFIVLRVGNSSRMRLSGESLTLLWEAAGWDPRIKLVRPTDGEIERQIRLNPTARPDFVRQRLLKVCLRDDSSVSAWTFPGEQCRMGVLSRSFDEIFNELFGHTLMSDLRDNRR